MYYMGHGMQTCLSIHVPYTCNRMCILAIFFLFFFPGSVKSSLDLDYVFPVIYADQNQNSYGLPARL